MAQKPFSIEKRPFMLFFDWLLALDVVDNPVRIVLLPAITHILRQRLHLSRILISIIKGTRDSQGFLLDDTRRYQCTDDVTFQLQAQTSVLPRPRNLYAIL